MSLDLNHLTADTSAFFCELLLQSHITYLHTCNILTPFTRLVGRIASEEVIIHLVKTKCLPILLYGLECYPLNKADTRSLDFAVTRFLMKMFRTVNVDVIDECRSYFDFMLPSELLVKRKSNFLRKFNSCSSIVCHFGFAKCVKINVCNSYLFIFIS